MNFTQLKEQKQSSEVIGPTRNKQIWIVYKHFFLVKKRDYIRTIVEIFFALQVVAAWFFTPSKAPERWDMANRIMIFSFITLNLMGLCWLQREKATGFRSLMHAMGLKKSSYYLGVSLSILTITLPYSLMIGYSLISVKDQDAPIPFAIYPLLFILYPIQNASIVFAQSSLCKRGFLVILTFFIWPLALLADVCLASVCAQLGGNRRIIAIILSHASPYMAMGQMVESAELCRGKSNIIREPTCSQYINPPLYVSLLLMIFWSVVMYYFSWYYDPVCSGREYSSQGEKKAARLWQHDEESSDKVPDPFVGYNTRYFEEAPRNKPLGIHINDVTKLFSDSGIVADSLSLNVYRGQTTLLLGQNGTGKTTLMNMIVGNLAPNYGKIYINGYDMETCSEEARLGVGWCPQQSILWDCLTVQDHLELFASIKCNYSGPDKQKHIDLVLRSVGLLHDRDKRCKTLAGGLKRKLSLAMALVGDSDVLILDEPSSGVDPESRKSLWDCIRACRSNRTVLLSTQHMEEADYLADRIAIVSSGKVVCCGSPAFLKKSLGSAYRLRIECLRDSHELAMSKVYNHFPDARIEDANIQWGSNKDSKHRHTSVELRAGDDNYDDRLIQLLEDLEQNHASLGVESFGLECTTIEDVLLNSAKTFGSVKSSENIAFQLETLTQKNYNDPTFTEILLAFLSKHLSEARAYPKTTIFLRLILPVLLMHQAFCQMMPRHVEYIPLPLINKMYDPTGTISLIAICFFGYPLYEQISKFKWIQLCSKATYLHYWLSRSIVDFGCVVLYCCLAFCLMQTYNAPWDDGYSRGFKFFGFILPFMLQLCLALLLLAYLLSARTTSRFASIFTYVFVLEMYSVVAHFLYRVTPDKEGSFPHHYGLYYIIPTVTVEWTVEHGIRGNSSADNDSRSHDLHRSVWLGLLVMLLQSLAFALVLFTVERKRVNIFSFLWPSTYFIKKRPSGVRNRDEDVDKETLRVNYIMDNNSERANNALVAQELTKSYTSKKRAVDGVTFAVGKSECFGLLGPNGAGKSTLLSMLTGDIRADYGRISCNNLSPENGIEAYCESLGFDPQSNPSLGLSPFQALQFMARLRGIDELAIEPTVEAFLVLLDIQKDRDKSVANLSGGTKRKLFFAMAVIGNPAVLMLDEPTAGIDPVVRRNIWQLLDMLKSKNGSSVIISSHTMEECESICDRLTIIIEGRMRCVGSLQSLRSKFGQGCIVRIQFDSTITPNHRDQIETIRGSLAHSLQTSVSTDDIGTSSVVFKVADAKIARSLIFKSLKALKSTHSNISYLVGDATLQDIFVAITREHKEPVERPRDFFNRSGIYLDNIERPNA